MPLKSTLLMLCFACALCLQAALPIDQSDKDQYYQIRKALHVWATATYADPASLTPAPEGLGAIVSDASAQGDRMRAALLKFVQVHGIEAIYLEVPDFATNDQLYYERVLPEQEAYRRFNKLMNEHNVRVYAMWALTENPNGMVLGGRDNGISYPSAYKNAHWLYEAVHYYNEDPANEGAEFCGIICDQEPQYAILWGYYLEMQRAIMASKAALQSDLINSVHIKPDWAWLEDSAWFYPRGGGAHFYKAILDIVDESVVMGGYFNETKGIGGIHDTTTGNRGLDDVGYLQYPAGPRGVVYETEFWFRNFGYGREAFMDMLNRWYYDQDGTQGFVGFAPAGDDYLGFALHTYEYYAYAMYGARYFDLDPADVQGFWQGDSPAALRPTVNLLFEPAVATVGKPVTVTVRLADGDTAAAALSASLQQDGITRPLSGSGLLRTYSFTPVAEGELHFTASVGDGSATGVSAARLRVHSVDPQDVTIASVQGLGLDPHQPVLGEDVLITLSLADAGLNPQLRVNGETVSLHGSGTTRTYTHSYAAGSGPLASIVASLSGVITDRALIRYAEPTLSGSSWNSMLDPIASGQNLLNPKEMASGDFVAEPGSQTAVYDYFIDSGKGYYFHRVGLDMPTDSQNTQYVFSSYRYQSDYFDTEDPTDSPIIQDVSGWGDYLSLWVRADAHCQGLDFKVIVHTAGGQKLYWPPVEIIASGEDRWRNYKFALLDKQVIDTTYSDDLTPFLQQLESLEVSVKKPTYGSFEVGLIEFTDDPLPSSLTTLPYLGEGRQVTLSLPRVAELGQSLTGFVHLAEDRSVTLTVDGVPLPLNRVDALTRSFVYTNPSLGLHRFRAEAGLGQGSDVAILRTQVPAGSTQMISDFAADQLPQVDERYENVNRSIASGLLSLTYLQPPQSLYEMSGYIYSFAADDYAAFGGISFRARSLGAPQMMDVGINHLFQTVTLESEWQTFWLPWSSFPGGLTVDAAENLCFFFTSDSTPGLTVEFDFVQFGQDLAHDCADYETLVPVFTSDRQVSATVGEAFQYQCQIAVNPAHPLLATNGYTAQGWLPEGLSIADKTQGIISGTPAPGSEGVYVLELIAKTQTGIGNGLGSLTIVVGPAAGSDAYQSWRETKFASLSGGTAHPDAAHLVDPDGDGLSNLLEYAFGLEPLAVDASAPQPAYTLREEAGELRFQFRRLRASGTGSTEAGYTVGSIHYTVEASADLQSWQTGAAFLDEVGSPTDNADGTETVTVRLLGNTRFARLKIDYP